MFCRERFRFPRFRQLSAPRGGEVGPIDPLANLRGSRPARQKAWLFARNLWIKVRHQQACCGHPGEPGC